MGARQAGAAAGAALTVGGRRLLVRRRRGRGRRAQQHGRRRHALQERVQLPQRQRVVQRLQRPDGRHAAEALHCRCDRTSVRGAGGARGAAGCGAVTSLTVAGGRRGDHDAQVGRGAGAGDDGGAEEPRGRQLAARAEPEHLEVAHLAGDAVPLAPPCVPRGATLLAMAWGHVAVRQVRP